MTFLLILTISGSVFFGANAGAQTNEGLYIEPLTQRFTLKPSESKQESFVAMNKTDKPMTVNLQLQRFGLTDISYDYKFSAPLNDWVKLPNTHYDLQPGQKVSVPFQITVSKDAAGGGYYYAVMASAPVVGQTNNTTVRIAKLLYVSVDGKGLKRAVELVNAHVPLIVTGTTIPYEYDIKNSGNIHIDARLSVASQGLFGNETSPEQTRTILPDTTRRISGSLLAPSLPGIYRFTYGYVDNVTSAVVTKSSYVVFVPPWSLVAILLVIAVIIWLIQRARRRKRDQSLPTAV